jgi:hypothetical protein
VSVLYATAAELASYLKQDVDTSTATLDLQILSELFAKRAHTRFESTSATYSQPGTNTFEIVLPFQPLIAVSADPHQTVRRARRSPTPQYSVIAPSVYRKDGFGSGGRRSRRTWWRSTTRTASSAFRTT